MEKKKRKIIEISTYEQYKKEVSRIVWKIIIPKSHSILVDDPSIGSDEAYYYAVKELMNNGEIPLLKRSKNSDFDDMQGNIEIEESLIY